jgi:hypothetical protein
MYATSKSTLRHIGFIPPVTGLGFGTIEDMQEYATRLNYQYFSWNDRVYHTESKKDTGLTYDQLP